MARQNCTTTTPADDKAPKQPLDSSASFWLLQCLIQKSSVRVMATLAHAPDKDSLHISQATLAWRNRCFPRASKHFTTAAESIEPRSSAASNRTAKRSRAKANVLLQSPMIVEVQACSEQKAARGVTVAFDEVRTLWVIQVVRKPSQRANEKNACLVRGCRGGLLEHPRLKCIQFQEARLFWVVARPGKSSCVSS